MAQKLPVHSVAMSMLEYDMLFTSLGPGHLSLNLDFKSPIRKFMCIPDPCPHLDRISKLRSDMIFFKTEIEFIL